MDYVFDGQHNLPTTPVAKWEANIKALRLLKDLDAEKRAATEAEQQTLAAYSGFGDSAFGAAFRGSGGYYPDPAWRQRREDLEGIVSQEEMRGIERSRINAFYTTPEVVKAMWDGLSDMGADKLKRPRVLEPSAGSGRFLGMQPPAMAAKSERTAVELDPMTSGILRRLYPDTKVYNAGFQEAPVPDNHFDVAISNVPFGNVRVFDPEFNATGRKHLTGSIHNYFFAKTLDKLRPGGVMAFVTSHHTMDAPKARDTREYLAERADLVGAVRLPQDAFGDTQVVTDIMYLRKRADGDPPADKSWVETDRVDIAGSQFAVNRYFVEHPEKVLGEGSNTGSMYGGGGREYTVKSAGKYSTETLNRQLGEVTRASAPMSEPAAQVAAAAAPKARPPGPPRYVLEDGELRTGASGATTPADLPPATAAKVKDLVGIRDAARDLVTAEAGGRIGRRC